MKGIKVLVVFTPHPDDAEIFCGGVILKYLAMGWTVIIVTVTSGNRGHLKIPPEELAKVRQTEAQNSADVAGAELVWLGWEDTEIEESLERRNQIIEVIRQFKPELVLSPDPGDYHSDHQKLGELIVAASYLVGVPHLQTKSEACPPPKVYFYETHGGIGFTPEIWVDISEFFPTKLEMLECHQSQLEWLLKHDGFDVIAYIKTKDRWHGFQSGCKYAEVFRPHRVFPVSSKELI